MGASVWHIHTHRFIAAHRYNDVQPVHGKYRPDRVQPRPISPAVADVQIFQTVAAEPQADPKPVLNARLNAATLDLGSVLPAQSHAAHSPDFLPDKAHPRPGLTRVSNVYKLKWPLKKRHGCVTDSLTF